MHCTAAMMLAEEFRWSGCCSHGNRDENVKEDEE